MHQLETNVWKREKKKEKNIDLRPAVETIINNWADLYSNQFHCSRKLILFLWKSQVGKTQRCISCLLHTISTELKHWIQKKFYHVTCRMYTHKKYSLCTSLDAENGFKDWSKADVPFMKGHWVRECTVQHTEHTQVPGPWQDAPNRDRDVLETVQQRAIKIMKRLEHT